MDRPFAKRHSSWSPGDYDGSVPLLYREKCRGRAEKRWAKTLAFRRKYGVDEVAERFWNVDRVQRAYPHYVYGRTKNRNQVLVWEFVGDIDVDQLPSCDEVTEHFVFFHEFLGRQYQGEETRLVSVLDLEGLKYSSILNRRALELLTTAAAVAEQLVPCRLDVVAIRNAPRWFAFAVANIPLPASFTSKFLVLSSDDELHQFFDGPAPSKKDLAVQPDHLALLSLAKCHQLRYWDSSSTDSGDITPQSVTSKSSDDYPTDEDDDGDVFYDCRASEHDVYHDTEKVTSSSPVSSPASSPRTTASSSPRTSRRRRQPRAPRRPLPRRPSCTTPPPPCGCRFGPFRVTSFAACVDLDDDALLPPVPPAWSHVSGTPPPAWWPMTSFGGPTSEGRSLSTSSAPDLRSLFSYFCE